MKSLLFILLLAHGSQVFSADRILNGGNAVVCGSSPINGNLTIELLDYYELKLSGGKLALEGNGYVEILRNLFAKWKKVAPERMTMYEKWLEEFKDEVGLYSGVSIPPIPDTGSIVIPSGCELKPIGFQRSDSDVFPGVKRYMISKDLWDLMAETQKAGLVLHELIYREGIKANHKTSFPTRYFNGYLSSATPKSATYSSVVSKLPLEWVEYGNGMVLTTYKGPILRSDGIQIPISEDGYYDPGTLFYIIRKIVGDITTDNIKIEGIKISGEINEEQYATFKFSSKSFIIEFPSYVKSFDRLFVRSSKFSFDINKLKSHCSKIGVYAVGIPQTYRSGVSIEFGINCDANDQEVFFNPKNSWIITKTGILVEGIFKMAPHGAKLYTTKGEIWTFKQGDYVLKINDNDGNLRF